ncbi:ABC transporter permease, partial [Staphylococcus capitis]|uniref:ABC transporter permease n=1 Tax=Staphylococcus capitis TaxID=29388 RepID=UPI0028CB540B
MFIRTALPLPPTLATPPIKFTPNELIPIPPIFPNNPFIPINLPYQNLHPSFLHHISPIQSKLTLSPTPNIPSNSSITHTIPFAILPTIHSLKTYPLLSIPPIITPLIIRPLPPLQ